MDLDSESPVPSVSCGGQTASVVAKKRFSIMKSNKYQEYCVNTPPKARIPKKQSPAPLPGSNRIRRDRSERSLAAAQKVSVPQRPLTARLTSNSRQLLPKPSGIPRTSNHTPPIKFNRGRSANASPATIQPVQTTQPIKKSNDLLANKFKKEFMTILKINNISTMNTFVNYDTYKALLAQLGFTSSTKNYDDKVLIEIWSLITYIFNKEMKISSLYNFLCCLQSIDNITD